MYDHMITLTILDVLHIKMNAGHQNTHSLRTLVAQELHHLRVDETKKCEQWDYARPRKEGC